jgi:hypothetical protein
MADEPVAAPLATEDTPAAPEAPVSTDTPTPESPEVIDYKQRYEDLRPEFDRRNELLADIEGRNGPDRQARALQEHARIELEDEEAQAELEDDEFELPPDPGEEIAQIRQELAERDEASEQAEFNDLEDRYIEATLGDLEGKENLKLTDDEKALVRNYGLNNRDEFDGKPDLEGGFAALKASLEADRKRYMESKRNAVLAPVGTEGEQKINTRDPEARRKAMADIYEAEEGREE